jgi:hypothetical protein
VVPFERILANGFCLCKDFLIYIYFFKKTVQCSKLEICCKTVFEKVS